MEEKKIILLIEDNRMDIELTLDAFSEAELFHHIQVAKTGPDALDYLYGKGQFQDREVFPLPDLILLDLKMPGMSGHEILKHIKSHKVLKIIPIVILTSSREKEDLVNCYENGVNSYIVKPVSFEKFLIFIKEIARYWLTINTAAPGQ